MLDNRTGHEARASNAAKTVPVHVLQMLSSQRQRGPGLQATQSLRHSHMLKPAHSDRVEMPAPAVCQHSSYTWPGWYDMACAAPDPNTSSALNGKPNSLSRQQPITASPRGTAAHKVRSAASSSAAQRDWGHMSAAAMMVAERSPLLDTCTGLARPPPKLASGFGHMAHTKERVGVTGVGAEQPAAGTVSTAGAVSTAPHVAPPATGPAGVISSTGVGSQGSQLPALDTTLLSGRRPGAQRAPLQLVRLARHIHKRALQLQDLRRLTRRLRLTMSMLFRQLLQPAAQSHTRMLPQAAQSRRWRSVWQRQLTCTSVLQPVGHPWQMPQRQTLRSQRALPRARVRKQQDQPMRLLWQAFQPSGVPHCCKSSLGRKLNRTQLVRSQVARTSQASDTRQQHHGDTLARALSQVLLKPWAFVLDTALASQARAGKHRSLYWEASFHQQRSRVSFCQMFLLHCMTAPQSGNGSRL